MVYKNLIGKTRAIFLTTAIIIIIYPIIALLLRSLHSSSSAFSFIHNQRILLLFTKTFIWALLVSLSVTVVASLASSFLWIKKVSNSIIIYSFLLLGFLIPPFVHSATWSQILVNILGFSYSSISSMSIAGWVQFSCYASLATGIILLALSKINKQEVAVAKIYRSDKDIFKKIILPSIKPVIIIIFGVIFILSFSDYTVPSLFAQSVYSQEIMAEFNSSYNQARALFLAIPLLVVQVLVFVLILIQLKENLYQKLESYDYNLKITLPKTYNILLKIGLVAVFCTIVLPIAILVFNKETITSLPNALIASDNEIISSLRINILAAFSIMIFILPLSLSILASKNSKLFLILFVLPLILPSSLVGIALINAFFGVLPKTIYNSSLMPIIAVWQKSLPFVLLINIASLRLLAKRYIEPASILGSKLKVFFKILLPLYLPTVVASFVITFIMGFNELSATLLVVPPGQSTLAIKIYNYLHYGASNYVNALCLFILVLALCSTITTGLLWKKGRFARDRIN